MQVVENSLIKLLKDIKQTECHLSNTRIEVRVL